MLHETDHAITYQVNGTPIARQVQGFMVRCPHVGLDEKPCGGVVTTIGDHVNKETGAVRTMWDPKAWQVFMGGGTVAVVCGTCGSKLEVTKPLLVEPNTGPNRQQKRIKTAQLRMVK